MSRTVASCARIADSYLFNQSDRSAADGNTHFVAFSDSTHQG